MFEKIKSQVKVNFDKMSKNQTKLFQVTVDRDKIWDLYLLNFDEATRQEHNCNCCKSFFRQFASIVTIGKDNVKQTMFDNIVWDDDIEEYKKSIEAVRKYIHSLPISDIFLNDFDKLGTDKNKDSKREIVWKHYQIILPKELIFRNKDQIDTVKGTHRDNKNVLKRSLDELTIDAIDTIVELINQGSLYRGEEFKGMVGEFQKLKTQYSKVPNDLKDNFCWVKSNEISQALSRIRNTSIGTLLIDLSEGKELDVAVSAFERVVAPTNYKRPTALITPRMVEDAKKTIKELGFENSLERRFATAKDIAINNLLFVDRSSDLKDIFDELQKDVMVNPKSLTKVEEVSIEDFITKILPTSKSVEVLLENKHLNNMVSLVTAADKEAPSMFKWNNPFSWSYTGGITDSMKERVKAAGGKVDGVLRFTIQWNEDGKSIVDLDAHAWEPKGEHIFYSAGYRKDSGNRRTPMSGQLDVDMINPRTVGIENITWSDESTMKEGVYKFAVHNFNSARTDGFRAQIEFNGEIHEFNYPKMFNGTIQVAEVTYSKANGFTIKSLIESSSALTSKEKWGVKTNQFVKVKSMLLSPNHWDNKVGNKHYMFILEGCEADEKPRPFYNEFLKEELNTNRKVFEVLGSKVPVAECAGQLSGVGFSDTQRNHIIVKVNGAFKRNLKITF